MQPVQAWDNFYNQKQLHKNMQRIVEVTDFTKASFRGL
jgi:hypothetical protein